VLSTFNPADVTAVQSRLVRQGLLGHCEPAPLCTNALAENVQVRVHPPMSPGR